MAPPAKAAGAFRTIGELAAETGLPQHILRYWETRFSQLRPLQRAGNRRYYRPADVALVHRINRLLNEEGYTVRGVQQLLERRDEPAAPSVQTMPSTVQPTATDRTSLARIRAILADALATDAQTAFR